MLAYPNFRDIPSPLHVYRQSLEGDAPGVPSGAYPRAAALRFDVTFDQAFMVRAACLCFADDSNGRVTEIPLHPSHADAPGRDAFSAIVSLSDLCAGEMDGLFYYHVVGDTVYGRLYSHGEDASPYAWLTDEQEHADAYQLLVYRDDFSTPAFMRQGVMYQIFVDRFFRGGHASARPDVVMATSWDAEITQYPAYPGAPLANDLFYGGDLDGVREKLPYLRSLGITVLYLCPIFEACSNHKYDTGDYEQVDAMFGGRAALDRLLEACRAQGVHVILDGVFNHTGAISRYFNQDGRYDSLGAAQSLDSPYYPWYRFSHYPDAYDCWWGVSILPAVNSAEPSYIQYITGENGIVDCYMRAGVSGFRLDVADELQDPFLYAIRARIRACNAEGAVIGEVWEDASNKIAYGRRRQYLRGRQLDSAMNYPLKDAIISFVLKGDAPAFARVTQQLYAHYPRPVSEVLMNILGTHDTERILTVLGGTDTSHMTYEAMANLRLSAPARALARKRLCLAYALLCFMPGIPSIYYGDEAGMEGARDPFNRRTYPWGQEDGELVRFFSAMGHLRQAYQDILAHGLYRVCYAEGDRLCLERKMDAGRLLFLCNRGDAPTTFVLPDETYRLCMSGEVRLQEVWTLPPCEGVWLYQGQEEEPCAKKK